VWDYAIVNMYVRLVELVARYFGRCGSDGGRMGG
jgi:hypothetical protein